MGALTYYHCHARDGFEDTAEQQRVRFCGLSHCLSAVCHDHFAALPWPTWCSSPRLYFALKSHDAELYWTSYSPIIPPTWQTKSSAPPVNPSDTRFSIPQSSLQANIAFIPTSGEVLPAPSGDVVGVALGICEAEIAKCPWRESSSYAGVETSDVLDGPATAAAAEAAIASMRLRQTSPYVRS